MTVELSTPEATPGQEVDITVISKPNSYIGLMGIDQSVLLLREGNDLDQTEVFSELEVYSKRGQSYGKWNTKTSADFSVRRVNCVHYWFPFLITNSFTECRNCTD